MPNPAQLEAVITFSSEANTFEEAVNEWDIVDFTIDKSRKGQCLCGQKNLKHCFTIKNTKNGNTLKYVGSDCIAKFGREDLNQKARELTRRDKGVNALIEKALHLGKNKKLSLRDPLFTPETLQFMYEDGCFVETKFNHGDIQHELDFLLDMINEPYWTKKQDIKVKAIIREQIYPYLRRKYAENTSLRPF